MFIINKERNDVYNIVHITNIYIGSDGCTIKVAAGTATRGGILGKYTSVKETETAFLMLIEGIKKDSAVFEMPSDADVGNKIKAMSSSSYHHITGRKTKGHGAS